MVKLLGIFGPMLLISTYSKAQQFGEMGTPRPDSNNQVWESKCQSPKRPISGVCNVLGSLPNTSSPSLYSFGIVGDDNAWQCTWTAPLHVGEGLVQAVCQ